MAFRSSISCVAAWDAAPTRVIVCSSPGEKTGGDTRKQLGIMTETSDGFCHLGGRHAYARSGRYGGTQQSGLAFSLQVANLTTDGQILALAREAAGRILDAHPELLEREPRKQDGPASGQSPIVPIAVQNQKILALSASGTDTLCAELRYRFAKSVDWSPDFRKVDRLRCKVMFFMREKEFLPLVREKLGIEKLNPMQLKMMQAHSESRDIILLSPTGSGKTLAFILPMLKMLRPSTGRVQAVVVAPKPRTGDSDRGNRRQNRRGSQDDTVIWRPQGGGRGEFAGGRHRYHRGYPRAAARSHQPAQYRCAPYAYACA